MYILQTLLLSFLYVSLMSPSAMALNSSLLEAPCAHPAPSGCTGCGSCWDSVPLSRLRRPWKLESNSGVKWIIFKRKDKLRIDLSVYPCLYLYVHLNMCIYLYIYIYMCVYELYEFHLLSMGSAGPLELGTCHWPHNIHGSIPGDFMEMSSGHWGPNGVPIDTLFTNTPL